MKRKICLVLLWAALFLGLALPAWAWEETVVWNGVSYTVDTQAGTISDGENSYAYRTAPTEEGYTLELTYPNGAQFHWTRDKAGGRGSSTGDYDPMGSPYPNGATLEGVLEQAGALPIPRAMPWEGKSIVVLLLLGAAGLLCLLAPRALWFLETGWRIRGAEPTAAALVANRVLGGVVIAAALAWFFLV